MPFVPIIFVQGRKMVALLQPWSTTVRIESNPFDSGRSMIRSKEMVWNGGTTSAVVIG